MSGILGVFIKIPVVVDTGSRTGHLRERGGEGLGVLRGRIERPSTGSGPGVFGPPLYVLDKDVVYLSPGSCDYGSYD